MNKKTVVEINDIKKYFPLRGGSRKNKRFVKAVDGISLEVYEGETSGTGRQKAEAGKTIPRQNDSGAAAFLQITL